MQNSRSETNMMENRRSETSMMENRRSETSMMENRPGGHRFHLRLILKANNTVGEQITVEQLIEKRKVMTISKEMIMQYRHHLRVK